MRLRLRPLRFIAILLIVFALSKLVFAQGYNSSGLRFGGTDAQTTAAPPPAGSVLTYNNGKVVGVPPLTFPCPIGQVASGLVNGVPSCVSNGLLPLVNAATLAALGPSPTPATYWCADCKIGTFQCIGGGSGNVAIPHSTVTSTVTSTATSTTTSTATGATSTATSAATATATTATIANDIQWTCPNFAATAIASPSATATPALSLALTVSPGSGPTPLAAAFSAVVSGGAAPYTYSLVPGDGGTAAAGPTPSHTYNSGGVFTASMTVTDNNAATINLKKTIFTTGPTYYVTKLGSDSNNGLTTAAPFLTLTKCQTAMQSGLKVCTIADSGVYTLGANLALTSTDANEVWTAGFGQSPTINGNGLYSVTANTATNVAFYGFTFTNMNAGTGGVAANLLFGSGYTFRWNTFSTTACNSYCILSGATTGSLIDSNTFLQVAPSTTNNALFSAFNGYSATSSTTISHNLCSGMNGACVNFNNGPSDSPMTNNTISYNLVINGTQGCVDCASFYALDNSATGGSANNFQFLNNSVFGFGPATESNHCIYLDQYHSGATITGNICAQNKGSGNLPNQQILIHGGQNNHVNNNILQVGDSAAYTNFFGVSWAGNLEFLYQTTGNTTMGGNQFQNDIIFTNGNWPTSGLNNNLGSVVTAPTFNQNDYWSATGAAITTWGNYTDSSAIVTTNPGFANASQNNFAVSNAPPGWTPLVGTQGPLNSPFVAAGSAF